MVKDLYDDEKIVGWSSRHLKTELALEAFRHAVFRRKPRRSIIFIQIAESVVNSIGRRNTLSHGGGNGKTGNWMRLITKAITDEIAGAPAHRRKYNDGFGE
ncbi:MAG: hypothetical protein HS115_19220 [Spirochaetales bacterium]|nr:hypothetical protein [Spirochaetales bacterium]